MNDMLACQLALDYCCTPAEVRDGKNHFSVYSPMDGRRRFDGEETTFLKIVCVNGKLLVTGREDIVSRLAEDLGDYNGAWFLEAKPLARLNAALADYGYRIGKFHPFFIADTVTVPVLGDYDIVWYGEKEIEQFRGDSRFNAAYGFIEEAPDVIGVGAWKNGENLGMAGASADSPTLWQIGINTAPEARGQGIGTALVTLLKNAILEQGKLPYYGTATSHIGSQKVAVRSGFQPAWAELITERIR